MQKMMEIILYLSQEIECEIYSSEVMKKICNKARNLRQENSAPNPDVLIHVSSAGKYRFSYLRPEIPAYSVPQCLLLAVLVQRFLGRTAPRHSLF
jgi:hypothetical protein